MEEAPPIIYDTDTPKVDDNEINFIEELKIKQENEEYRIKFETKGNGLIIKVVSESSKEIIHYQQYYNLYDLQKILIFSAYKYVNDIINVLKELKMEIEKKNNEIIIKFNAFMPNGQKRFIKLNLKKYILNDKEMVKYALDEIISIKNNMKNKEEIYNEEKIKNENEIKKLKEIISKAEAKISKLELDNMNYKNEISNLKNENEKLWKEINQIKLNNNYDSKSKLKSNLDNRNIENRIETDDSKSQEENEENEEDEIDDNNSILPKKNKKETEYNGEVEYQDNPKGYRFKIFEKNPETFTKIINSENEIVNLEFTIINKSSKTFPGNGMTKILFYKNGIVNIKEISLSQIKRGQKKRLMLVFQKIYFMEN